MEMPEGWEYFKTDIIPFLELHTQYWKKSKILEIEVLMKEMAEALEEAAGFCEPNNIGYVNDGYDKSIAALKKFKEWE